MIDFNKAKRLKEAKSKEERKEKIKKENFIKECDRFDEIEERFDIAQNRMNLKANNGATLTEKDFDESINILMEMCESAESIRSLSNRKIDENTGL